MNNPMMAAMAAVTALWLSAALAQEHDHDMHTRNT